MMSGIKANVGSKTFNETSSRKTRSDKKVRVCPYLTQEQYADLKKIARACDASPAQVSLEVIDAFLKHPEFITFIQDKFGVEQDDPYRIIPIVKNGKVKL
jgi:hypothetical protein